MPMWVLRTLPDLPPEPLTFRLLPGGARTVGRTSRADFILDASLVSRVHCRLVADADGKLEVEDLSSTNGTFVNDRRIERAVLVPGDRLRIGRVELMVSLEDGVSVDEPATATADESPLTP